MIRDHKVVLPTPLTDELTDVYEVLIRNASDAELIDALPQFITQLFEHGEHLERDCMTLALRLYGESADTFAPETCEVMDRWRPRVKQLLDGK